MAALSSHLRGRIAYRDAAGGETGHEWFDLIAGQGCRLLRALCVMDDIGLMREVSIGMGADWRPTDGQCRIWQDGAQNLMRFDVGELGVRAGDTFLPMEEPLPYLGLHPLSGDALIIHQRGQDAAGEYRAIAAVTNSISPNGEQDLAAQAMQIDVAYMGQAAITVAAGAFEAWHYRLRWRRDWPPADLWVRAGDGLFLLMRWALVPAWFELTQWQEGPL
ncbi:hypothetical protein EOE18_03255 [Novosphingobium umbonatum]|uniref:Uncharacterized protein n=1 Tax=Novosphingobium umbonatum TaxID=1908524 RepID=A0A437NAP6_9SPHN|nr:hypothetical protein [Novosphingobium umbonatum]RVU06989.1 hypothetical protein EOE18_03255 [Novosphingobium umbonatum]